MKILLLGDGVPSDALSEPAVWIEEICRRWAHGGHRVVMICPAEGAPGEESAASFPGVTVWTPNAAEYDAVLGSALTDNPDVVHVTTAGPFGSRAIEALREHPLVLDVHDYWPICPRVDLLHGPTHSACSEHHPFAGCGPCAGLPRLRAMESRAELVSSARVIVAHSSFARARLEAGLGHPVERLDDGVDSMRYRPDPSPPSGAAVLELFENRGRPRVLFLGPPTPARGAARLLDLLVAIRARVPDVELIVAGRDPESPDWAKVFQAEAAELGLAGHARTIERVAPDDLPALVASCHVAIAPGPGPERGGLFTLQALASGVPVVAHAAPWQAEWIETAENGLLVDGRDVPGFAAATATILIDGTVRHALGETARLRAMERHDLERSVFALEELYRRAKTAARPPAAA